MGQTGAQVQPGSSGVDETALGALTTGVPLCLLLSLGVILRDSAHIFAGGRSSFIFTAGEHLFWGCTDHNA